MVENAKFHLKDGREVIFSALRISLLRRRLGELVFGFLAIVLLALAVLALARTSSDSSPPKSGASLADRAGG